MNKEQVDFYKEIDHNIYVHDDRTIIICQKDENIYRITSTKDKLDLFCPGCGSKLKMEVIK